MDKTVLKRKLLGQFLPRLGRIELRYTKGEKVNESFKGFVEISSVSAESILQLFWLTSPE